MMHRNVVIGLTILVMIAIGLLVRPVEGSAAWLPISPMLSQDDDGGEDDDAEDTDDKEDELTLERLFPERSFFGPNARRMAFSHDAAYAAYLYRPYRERRHGNDLYLLNTETSEITRLTMVSVMSEFQKATREVKEDRIRKAKEAKKKRQQQQDDHEQQQRDDEEGEDDTDAADDDPVTGNWTGVIRGGEDLGLPPDGLKFTLEIELRDDDTVIGILNLQIASANLSEGRFNRETNQLQATLIDEEIGTTAHLTATIEDDQLNGEIVIDDMDVTLEIEGTRKGELPEPHGARSFSPGKIAPAPRAQDQDEHDEQDEGENEDDKEDDEEEEIDTETGDWVTEDDAEDRRAPRYSGVNNFTWSPIENELLFNSMGDLYRYEVESGEITRLTMTADTIFGDYLPDGAGYTYSSDNTIRRVMWGSHIIEQISPRIPSGERLSGYELSPDGKRAVVMTTQGEGWWGARTVNIARYRGRFMEVWEVPRTVSDDPLPRQTQSVYLYEIGDTRTEKSELTRVFSREMTGTRDVISMPNWAPDSTRVTFAVFEQESDLVKIMESAFPEPEADDEAEAEDEANDDDAEGDEGDGGERDEEEKDDEDDNDTDEDDADDEDEQEDEAPKPEEAQVIYKFLHSGGPNTPRMISPEYMADSRQVVFLSEQTGFRHLHLLDPLYEAVVPLTRGRFEVYPFDISESHERMFITSTKEHPTRLDVYSVSLEDGGMTRISKEGGRYSGVAVSDDAGRLLANFVSYGRLEELVYADDVGQKTLTDSHPEKAHELTDPTPEFFTYRNRHGHELHGMMFKPDDWSADDKRPLLIYVYGGPLGSRKEVTDGSYSSNSYFFAYYMAKKHGYVTCTIDTRGMSGYGGLFEKSNFEQIGRPQVEDLVDGAKWFAENQGVDPDRVGIHGWSFGGFQTQMCMYTEPDVFACGIAGAGPTEWENYNKWYSTGTVGETRDNHPDLEEYSLLPLAKNLEGELLLVHGMEDSNVLYQDTVRVYRALLQAGKETLVELFLDPTGGHGLGGDIERVNRYRKYEEFLLRCLGKGSAGTDPQPEQDEE